MAAPSRHLGDDPADGAALGSGRQGDDRLPAAACSRTAHEVDLPADAGVLPWTHGIGHDLAHQVDLQGGVDGDDVVVAADDEGVVRVAHREHVQDGIVIDEVVEASRAHEECRDKLVRVDTLAGVGDNTLLVEVDDAVAEHLRVDTEVVLLVQEAKHGLGNRPDADLKAGAVVDKVGDVPARWPLPQGRSCGAGSSRRGVELSTIASSRVTWMNVSPCVRGMFGFTWATIFLAASAAGSCSRLDRPNEHQPCLSGGDRWTSATSGGR